jgi:hypothetical protein
VDASLRHNDFCGQTLDAGRECAFLGFPPQAQCFPDIFNVCSAEIVLFVACYHYFVASGRSVHPLFVIEQSHHCEACQQNGRHRATAHGERAPAAR